MRNQKLNHHNTEQEQTFVESISPEDTERIVELENDIEVDEGQGQSQEKTKMTQNPLVTEQFSKIPVDKGLLFFIAEDGTVGYQVLGDGVSLENLTFFNAYLERILEEYWKNTETL